MTAANIIVAAVCAVLLALISGMLTDAASAAASTVAASRAVAQAMPVPARIQTPCISQREEPTIVGGITYFRDCADTPAMATFSGGQFRMGDLFGNGLSYELPPHDVHVAAFALARYEVSIAEWQQCMEASVCTAPSPDNASKPRNHPVVGVTWLQAHEYVDWLTQRTGRRYRLPSEAEWEYAARAGSRDQYSWGNRSEPVCGYANALDQAGHRAQPQMFWYVECDDGYATTAPVGSYPPNAWGLYDMLGNVWEWVEDCWHSDYSGAPTDGSAWISGGDCNKRVNRGGGWGNNPRALRVSNRDADPQDTRSDGMGFRVARNLIDAGK
ncbi:MAG: hypothetical protein JWR16_863 [Nevskia sp.]|nr:hypothetical protein [Nevskia sp.]